MNLFKRQVETQEVTVKEIHDAFNGMEEKLFNYAVEIINKGNTNNYKSLLDLGFTQANGVQEYVRQTELKGFIDHYRQNYPLYKFIQADQVRSLCAKYNLCMGKVSEYKGIVPIAKIQTMKQFRLNHEDYPAVFKRVEYEKPILTEQEWLRFKRTEPDNLLFKNWSNRISDERFLKSYLIKSKTACPEWEICAPKTEFKFKSVNEKYEIKPTDPIVLQEVKGGYLIIVAWGEEASDPIVVNELNN